MRRLSTQIPCQMHSLAECLFARVGVLHLPNHCRRSSDTGYAHLRRKFRSCHHLPKCVYIEILLIKSFHHIHIPLQGKPSKVVKDLTTHLGSTDSVNFQLLTEIARIISLESIGNQVIKIGAMHSNPLGLALMWFVHTVINIGGGINAAEVIRIISKVFTSDNEEMRKAARKLIHKLNLLKKKFSNTKQPNCIF